MHREAAGKGSAEDVPAQPGMTPEIAAEAAVWVTRLHGPGRSIRMERECLAWQARSAAHRLAFERCTDTWLDVAGLSLSAYARVAGASPETGHRPGTFKSRRWVVLVAGLGVLFAGVLLLQHWPAAEPYATAVGEQRLVLLHDGTRMSMNTATRVSVVLGAAQRTVNVEEGEALFEVAKDARRPFVVRAAGAEVLATGTVFVVRVGQGGKGVARALAVTLVEGQVLVRESQGGAVDARPSAPVVMAAGERIRMSQLGHAASPAASLVDRPRMEQVLAWKRGEAHFDDLTLSDAAAEMNRYSPVPLVLSADVAALGLRVSGVFRTGDSAGFARAVAALHGLQFLELPDRWELVAR